MFDDLRQQSDENYFQEDDLELEPVKRQQKYFLGLTPIQRLVLATMLLFMVCILGAFTLLVTEKIIPPFMY